MTWDSGVLSGNQRQILAGTPEGFVLIIDDEISRNAPGMQITNMAIASSGIITLTIINHNLSATPFELPNDEDYILLENIVADSGTMAALNGTIWPVYSVVDSDTITINTYGLVTSGTYMGGGTAARVSNIQIKSKQWNPYVDNDREFLFTAHRFWCSKNSQWSNNRRLLSFCNRSFYDTGRSSFDSNHGQ